MTYQAPPEGIRPLKYTCNEYRQEMILAGLHRRLAAPNLTSEEKKQLRLEIEKLEIAMGLN